MKSIKYQQKAVAELVEKTIDMLNLSGTRHKLIFKAPTGSGKTVMASEMLKIITEELPARSDVLCNRVAFIWIAPNKLHEQSYFKMKNFFTETRVLHPVMFDELDHADGSIKPGEILFVNWESINKDNAVMIRDNEQNRSLYTITHRTQVEENTPIICIIDEEHMFGGRNARKSENVLQHIQPKIEIRISATPITVGEQMVSVPRDSVVREEMIKEGIILNPAITKGFADERTLNQHLIKTALEKRNELAAAYGKLGVNINPLLLIQLPNDTQESLSSEESQLVEQIQVYLETMHNISAVNGKMAVWLSGNKQNLDGVERPDNMVDVLLFKQAIALGWDCPRAAVLLIFRKLESFTFTVQTIGRILRMPEQKFYTDDLLNKGYVYTDLSADKIQIVKDDMDYISTIHAVRRENLSNVTLRSVYQERTSAERNRLGVDFKEMLRETFANLWQLKILQLSFDFDDEQGDEMLPFGDESQASQNRKAAQTNKRINFEVRSISVEIPEDVRMTGDETDEIAIGSKAKFAKNAFEINRIFLAYCRSLLNGFEKSHSTDVLAKYLTEVMEDLFELFEVDAQKVVLYYENKPKFTEVIMKALEKYRLELDKRQKEAKAKGFTNYDWEVPEDRIYNESSNEIVETVDEHALLPFVRQKSASEPEKQFEAYLEDNRDYIDWWYKNGDSGKQHYAVEYKASDGTHSLFYVDFVIRMKNGQVLLFDTKSVGSDTEGPNKHNALIDYMASEENKAMNLKGGIIIKDKQDNWRFCRFRIENTDDLTGWDCFFPNEYQ